MTELELMELLSDVHGGYIRQADAFRQGQLRITKKKHPMVTALQILSTAAMFVAILGAGYLGLCSQMKMAAQKPDRESTVMATGSEAMDTGTAWQLAVLGDELPFYNLENENSVTLSQFCENLSQAMGTREAPKPDRYTALDLDGDGQKELVVEFRGTGDLPRLVLGYFDGELRGSIYYNRQMDQIKEDGTFYYSGGIGNRGWARLQKFGGHWVEEELEGDYSSLPDTLWTQWVPQDTETEPETGGTASNVGSREQEASFTLTRYIDSEQKWEEYPVPVQLYRADGYSTYIPKEGFERSEGTYGGRSALRWEYKGNRDVWFSVVPLDTTSFNEAIQWGLSAGGPGDTLMEDKSGGICGQSTDGSLFWAITFHEKDFKGIYAVICHYPVAQTDGLAAYVKLMADAFQAE